jgi:hypothetical protein
VIDGGYRKGGGYPNSVLVSTCIIRCMTLRSLSPPLILEVEAGPTRRRSIHLQARSEASTMRVEN